jgi:predicted Zn-dependent protease
MPLDLPRVAIDADFWSLRFVDQTATTCAVRKNVPLPLERFRDRGLMATVYADGGYGYAATSDLTPDGIRRALERARAWACSDRLARAVRHPALAATRATRATTRRRRSTRPIRRRASGTSS